MESISQCICIPKILNIYNLYMVIIPQYGWKKLPGMQKKKKKIWLIVRQWIIQNNDSDPQLIQMMELADNYIKNNMKTIFYMWKS